MNNMKSFLLLPFLLFTISITAQVQWYQNQDASNPFPNGTYACSVQPLNGYSFIACYQWAINNDENTWKISKTNTNGTEQRSFFLTGIASSVEVKVGRYNYIYLLEKKYPSGSNGVYTIYKIDNNLNVKAQRIITLPNEFTITALNAFELDEDDNVYVAGDGNYTTTTGNSPASFVIKSDRNLNLKWKKLQNGSTSFTRLHIDRHGKVVVLQDHQSFFPDIRITRIAANGMFIATSTVKVDAGRFNLFSKLDQDEDLIVYGGKTIGDTAQAIFLSKISLHTGRVVYKKTHFAAPGSQLNDFKIDRNGTIYSLVTQFFFPDIQVCKVSRINQNTGNIQWNRSFTFSQDSCILSKLVLDDNERFYAVGEQRKNTYFSKAFAIRLKKNGQKENSFSGPDSVFCQRSHTLVDGIIDINNQLIAIGNTNDYDTTIYSSSYFRSFAIRYDNEGCNNNNNTFNRSEGVLETIPEGILNIEEEETVTSTPEVTAYPNPAYNYLNVKTGAEVYDDLAVYNLQGALLLKQPVTGGTIRIDVAKLADGMYMLVLRSATTHKEKTIKFVVRK